MFLLSGCQLKELEDMLSDVYTTSQFVDTALDSGTDTQLILVKKQVLQYIHICSDLYVLTSLFRYSLFRSCRSLLKSKRPIWPF